MGDPSDLRFVPSSCATTPIDWTKVPEASSSTTGMFDAFKFFGYMIGELCTLLLDISEFGLAKPRFSATTVGLPVGPRFYMKYLQEVWFVLFVPESRDAITGFSPNIPHAEDSHEDAGIAHDKALAEDYDAKLCEEVRRIGTFGAVTSKRLAGWESSTLKRNLELAQMMKTFMPGLGAWWSPSTVESDFGSKCCTFSAATIELCLPVFILRRGHGSG
ncbi:uncharacterized protein LACBIDRAFT_326145 [Laccaria bicolor S238N-H82]|uniref:Predicted protein n=1 Tax=Laccaria bicolor (strain S238N-H82 / ATCC MYA-4686) TaxID=486041 RepID=B0D7F6_LACBS|nr:uncharacterized protein LACBIDRAFT_326145 [Laccaria bicolor S238N-H82]EDR09644.1 predicted protein [Laccaria bicolor S238N-H82]|eukprot:XP_001879993.1 predicted protein [Laccaria bicolor S238N-H82]